MTRNQKLFGAAALIAAIAVIAVHADRTERPQQVTLSADFMLQNALQSRGSSGPTIEPVDLTYHHTFTITGSPATLRVWPRDGSAPVNIVGTNVAASYYHVSHLLVVETVPAPHADHIYQYFTEPVRWERAGT